VVTALQENLNEVLRDIASATSEDQESFELLKRASGDREVIQEFRAMRSPLALGDIGRD
jgi:hypothetical protein